MSAAIANSHRTSSIWAPPSHPPIDPATVDGIAGQIRFKVPAGYTPVLSERTTERHRAEIRALLKFREAT
jgi:hypothetical protein